MRLHSSTKLVPQLDPFGSRQSEGRIVREAGDSDVRELFVKSYRLVYQVRSEVVIILSFIHTARDLGLD
jgi:hypothetical protein